ncbi:hypothetical protein MOQ72_27010 [Saccharopolyspora sp. K220]|uniref:hypothetical protein n=1 Tax=Saccharopolyspora soli TaxID=2926618 RepID=UPI001F5953FE|nr:hypothetical protein [Saccharopolyspora soli]MCI2421099.1 hypothetical protein [Saccharopolyspora soli]
MGARVPSAVAENWKKVVERIAEQYNIGKGQAAAIGLVVASQHLDEWGAMAAKLGLVEEVS